MKILLSVLLLASVAHWAAGNKVSDRPLTLQDCLNEGLGRNPALESQRYALAADKEAIWKVKASFLPDITAISTLWLLTGSPEGPFEILGVNEVDKVGLLVKTNSKSVQESKGPFRVSLQPAATGKIGMEYPIYAAGSIFGLNTPPAVKIAKADYNKQDWTIRLTQQEVIEKVAGVFLSTQALEQKVDLDQQKVRLSQKRLEILQEQLRLNLVLPQQVELAKAELAANQQLLQTTQQRAMDSERLLAEFLGRDPTRPVKLDQSAPAIPVVPPLEAFLNRVAAAHPSVAIQQANIEVAQQKYHLAQLALYPTVKAGVGYSGSTAFTADNLDLFSAQVGVQVPIFDFGSGLAAEHQARDELKSAQIEMDQVKLEIRESVLGQLSQIHTTESTLADLERNLVQANNNVDLIESEHDQGISTQLALVDAQLGLIGAKDDLLLTRLLLRVQYAQLQRLSGGVWVWNR
jgi:outer membrane protein TolC